MALNILKYLSCIKIAYNNNNNNNNNKNQTGRQNDPPGVFCFTTF